MDSQLPKGMSADKLRELDLPHQQAPQLEESPPVPPKFITQIQPQENQEGDSAHFECRLEPINDPKLRVEWYHNGKPLKSGTYQWFFLMLYLQIVLKNFINRSNEGRTICRQ